MNLTFYIQPNIVDTTSADLFIDINAQGFCFFILKNNICAGLGTYTFELGIAAEDAAAAIHQIISDQPVLQQRFNKVHVVYGYSAFILVPHPLMNGTDNNAMLELVYGENSERAVKTDFMYQHSAHIVYGIPVAVDKVIARYFEYAESTHVFALLPDLIKDEQDYLFCIFSPGQLKALLVKDGKLQVMQSFNYKTPEDAAFHLLNICKGFGVDVNKVSVHLSGMIDENSALFSHLYKYFLQIKFENLPAQFQYPQEINQFPAHYFSHLFSIAACV